MTDLTAKSTVCIVIVRQAHRGQEFIAWIFGVYENEKLARERVKELDFTIPEGTTIFFKNEILWKETEAEQ